MELQDYELAVKHKTTGKTMVISKRLYHSSPDEYDVIDGEPGKPEQKAVFVQPDGKDKDKMGKDEVDNKAPAPTSAKSAKVTAPPTL